VQGKVLRDYGVSTGIKNDYTWSRRDLYIDQDGKHIGLTLWNDQVFIIKIFILPFSF